MTLLLKNISAAVTCDSTDNVLENIDIFCRDGMIDQIGSDLSVTADRVLDCSHMLCYPGLINTHHHFYQIFSRNLPHVQGMQLFDWLRALYKIWQNLDAEVINLSSKCALGLLMKSGCTTAFDHHYVFPGESSLELLEAQFSAAEELGARMYASRGSMNLSEKDGGLPPDSVVQTTDSILKDSMAAVERFHDQKKGSMRMVALAPCSPFSASADLYRESAALARSLGVRLHTHLCETKDEEDYMIAREGMRPLEYMEKVGWIGDDVWYAHGIHFNDAELAKLAETGTGVCHCPISNMKLSSGIARIPEMLHMGIPVGLGVDGSASNDGSDLLEEIRVAFLLHRLNSSKDAPTGYDILRMATIGSARLLGRDKEIGSIETGKCADFFLIDSNRTELTGACYDPASVLGTVGVRGAVDYTVIDGEITVEHGRICGVDEEKLSADSDRELKRYLAGNI